MLPATHRSSTRLGGRVILLLLIAAGLVWVLPTLRSTVEQGNAQAADEPAGSENSSNRRKEYICLVPSFLARLANHGRRDSGWKAHPVGCRQ